MYVCEVGLYSTAGLGRGGEQGKRAYRNRQGERNSRIGLGWISVKERGGGSNRRRANQETARKLKIRNIMKRCGEGDARSKEGEVR